MSLGKTSQFTRHTTTIEVNTLQSSYDPVNVVEVNGSSKIDVIQKKKDILNEMQHHLKQMEQELAIVSEESKDLQQRLTNRQQDLEKKVSNTDIDK